MHFSFYVVNLPLAYGEDTDKVSAILREVGEELQRDDAYMPFILEPLDVIGVDAFEETAVRLKVADQDGAAETVVRGPRAAAAPEKEARGARRGTLVAAEDRRGQ